MASWASRSTAPGVIRAWHWNGPDKLGTGPISSQLSPQDWGWGYGDTGMLPEIDLSDGCSSAGCLKLTVPSVVGANGSGSWQIWFNDNHVTNNYQKCIGVLAEGAPYDEIWTQLRTKWNPVLCNTTYQNFHAFGGDPDTDGYYAANAGGQNGLIPGSGHGPAGLWNGSDTVQTGIKFFDITSGWPMNLATGSSSNGKAVLQSIRTDWPRVPIVYGYSGINNHNTWGWGDETLGPGYSGKDQSEMPAPYCQYGSWQNCFTHVPDEWITYKIRHKILDRVTSEAVNFEGDLWAQRDGGPEVHLIHHTPSTPGYNPKWLNVGEMIGMLVIFPYMTYRYVYQNPPPGIGYARYDELIISTQDIAAADGTSGVLSVRKPVSRFRRV